MMNRRGFLKALVIGTAGVTVPIPKARGASMYGGINIDWVTKTIEISSPSPGYTLDELYRYLMHLCRTDPEWQRDAPPMIPIEPHEAPFISNWIIDQPERLSAGNLLEKANVNEREIPAFQESEG